MPKFGKKIAIAIVIGAWIMLPNFSYASLEEKGIKIGNTVGASTGLFLSSIGSTLDQSVDAVTNVASSMYHASHKQITNAKSQITTNFQSSISNFQSIFNESISQTQNFAKRHHSMVRQAKNHLMSRGHQMLRSLPDVQASLSKQFARVNPVEKTTSFFYGVKQGFRELLSQKEELVFTEKQETHSLANVEITPSNPPYVKGDERDLPNESIRYATNAENQPIKIIERIIVKESSKEHVSRSKGNNETNSLFHDTSYALQDPRINSLITNVADLTSRLDEKDGSPYRNSALFNMIAQSQRIKTLDDVKITNATIEGYATSKGVSDSLATYLPLGGGHTYRESHRNLSFSLKHP